MFSTLKLPVVSSQMDIRSCNDRERRSIIDVNDADITKSADFCHCQGSLQALEHNWPTRLDLREHLSACDDCAGGTGVENCFGR